MELNPEQILAVQHIEGPMLVIAGAGSGKTRTITARIQHLLSQGVRASRILALTFTNKAAQEMRERIDQQSASHILATTFHSLGARILRESIEILGYSPHFTIFDEDESEKLLKTCFKELNLKEEKEFLKTARLEISHAKNNACQPKDQEHAYYLYQKKLKASNAIDFDDLLFLPTRIFKEFPEVLARYQSRWDFILIDEYQDTNHTQYTLVQLLAANHNNVFAVGDPDQSIYSWRGASIENILNFEKDFPGAKVVSLEQNYRSTNTILQAANALIHHNPERAPKNLWSNLGVGEKIGLMICDHDRDEAEYVIERLRYHSRVDAIPFKECVIFYRTNFQSRLFEDALLRYRIPYIMVGGLSFYQRKEIKDVLNWLRLVAGGGDFLAFSRTINLPKRGIGETTLAKIQECSHAIEQDLISTARFIVQRKIECKLSAKQFESLTAYVNTIDILREMVKANLPLHEIVTQTVERTHYLDYLKEDPETYDERRANVQELIAKTHEWDETKGLDALTQFLEELSLKSSTDQLSSQENSIRLMTVHHSKGLEFDLAFLVGMEEDLFPHVNSRESSSMIDEERRLCYVGITRAKKLLYLSAAKHRFLWGTSRRMHPSRFLKEIPPQFFRSSNALSENDGSFETGDLVVHHDFGEGIIRKKYHTSLGLTYDVSFFKGQTERTLIAKFAKLSLK
jgi:DNA helicase II / ATP-dependent DNA helicase PcrA